MTPEERQHLETVLREILPRSEGVRFAVLFGSQAKGTAQPESDLDLALQGAAPERTGEIGAQLSERLGQEVDIVRLEEATIPLLEELIDHSVVVYEAVVGSAALWRSRALAALEIDRPWYHRMRDAWLSRVAERGVLDGQ
jgi:predicted nucleotidyltransferase